MLICVCAGIAQLVERNLAKVEVAGSSPVSRSIFLCTKNAILLTKSPLQKH